MKVAIVHYWLVNMRGGEKVLESLSDLFPQADIYTHVYDADNISDKLKKHSIVTTFINKLPWAKKLYPYYLPLMPLALESLDLTAYDLIISSESGPAKGIIPAPNALHISYVHSPMRYVWDMFHVYWGKSNPIKKAIYQLLMHKIRLWDSSSSMRTDVFIANSSFVKQRILKYYRRDALVINPPVDIEKFQVTDSPKADYYLYLGEFSSYKRPLDAVEAFNLSGKKLVMLGDGSEKNKLNKIAKSNIVFKHKVSNVELVELIQNCRALIYPGTEDFGIIPVEAMACGRPVIAHKSGGVLDSVIDQKTGLLYSLQNAQGLNGAVEQFEKIESQFCANSIRKHSELFSREQFNFKLKQQINQTMVDYGLDFQL